MPTISISGHNIDYDDSNIENTDIFINCGKLRWKMTDEYGWNIKKSEFRDIRLNNVLDITSNYTFIYWIYLTRIVEDGWGSYMISLKPHLNKLRLSGDSINVSLNCNNLKEAELLVDMLASGNDLEISSVSKVN